MKLTPRNQILKALRGDAGRSAAQLSSMLSIPQPSVRRLIHDLRRDGWAIGRRNDGIYCLFSGMTPTPQPST